MLLVGTTQYHKLIGRNKPSPSVRLTIPIQSLDHLQIPVVFSLPIPRTGVFVGLSFIYNELDCVLNRILMVHQRGVRETLEVVKHQIIATNWYLRETPTILFDKVIM